MRLLTWNLNHRAARRTMPEWVTHAIVDQSPDVAVLTEYVEADGHGAFVAALAEGSLPYAEVSERTVGHNQVLIVSKTPLTACTPKGLPLHPAVPSNILHVVMGDTGFHLIGCRIPAFRKDSEGRALKRAVWDWLIQAGRGVEASPAAVAGDLNTQLGDSTRNCGDLVPVLAQRGWQHAIPDSGCSWKSAQLGAMRRIDHTFLSPPVAAARARYLWDFEGLASVAGVGRPGVPDHAMLVVDF
jgi:hypothetical protein